jgi:hypothetical protein
VHRQPMYPTFNKWFGMPIPEKEYQQRLPAEDLLCLTLDVRAQIRFTALHELAGKLAHDELEEFRKHMAQRPKENQRLDLAQRWRELLGVPDLGEATIQSVKQSAAPGDVKAQLAVLKTKELVVPMLILTPPPDKRISRLVIALAQEGKAGFLKHRGDVLAELLASGVTVVLPDLPGCGDAAVPGDSRARASSSTSLSATAHMLGTTLLGVRLQCLRLLVDHLSATGGANLKLSLWGDSFAPTNPAGFRYQVPHDADKTPHLAEPLGPTLALLAGVTLEAPIETIYARGGLVSFRALLNSPFLYVPQDAVIPGALRAGDLDDWATAYLSRPGSRLFIDAPVDGLNRRVTEEALQLAHPLAVGARGNDPVRLRLSTEPAPAGELADWLRASN